MNNYFIVITVLLKWVTILNKKEKTCKNINELKASSFISLNTHWKCIITNGKVNDNKKHILTVFR